LKAFAQGAWLFVTLSVIVKAKHGYLQNASIESTKHYVYSGCLYISLYPNGNFSYQKGGAKSISFIINEWPVYGCC
jgi:hypothetical protein